MHLQEMPVGFRMLSDEPLTLQTLTQGIDRSLGRAQLAEAGFVSGVVRKFSYAGSGEPAFRLAVTYLVILKDAAAAIAQLNSSVPVDPQVSKTGIGETLGDASIAYRVTDPAGDTAVYAVVLRYANVTAYFFVQGSSSSVSLKEATALARKEVALLRADTEGPPLSTRTPRASPIFPVMFNLALRADDLPSGWKPFAGQPLSVDDFGVEMGTTLTQAGYRSGFGKLFESSDGTSHVDSTVLLVGDSGQAARVYRAIANLAIAHGAAEISVGDTIGDGSSGTEGILADPRAGASQGFVSLGVVFYSADAIAILTLTAPRGKANAEFIVDLAHKLLAHLV
jgi:hypothetical protein